MMAQAMQVGQLNRDAFMRWMSNMWLPDATPPAFPDDYTMVAVVEGEDVETAYRLTNHIDAPWWENEGVTLIGNPEHRSTSTGDVVVMPNGQVLRCDNAGWTEIVQGVE